MSRLFKKTLLVMIALFAVISAVTSFHAARTLDAQLTQEYRSKGTAIARSLADSSVELLVNRDVSTLQAIVDQFADIDGVAYVFVVDRSGEVISHTFVPRIPEQILRIIALSSGRNADDAPSVIDLDLDGFGSTMEIAAPILAGVAGSAHVGMDRGRLLKRIRSAVLQQQALVLTVLLVSIVLAYVLTNRISQPLNLLAQHARLLATHDFSGGRAISRSVESLSRTHRDEVGSVAASFVYMEQTLERYIRDLKETTAAKERIESELKIAHDIQMTMVPKTFPPFPDRHECDVFATLVPAKEVGGDFYDFGFIDANRLFVAIGDVSGKGVPAALFMATTRTLLRAIIDRPGGLDDTLSRLNDEICRDNTTAMFVTLFVGILDVSTGRMEYVNGGHNLPYVVSNDGIRAIENTDGTVLGAFEGLKYRRTVIDLRPGDGLLLYTDGVTEAMNSNKEVFSDRQLEEFLSGARQAPPRDLTDRLLRLVRRFAGDAPQSDDITILALRYQGA